MIVIVNPVEIRKAAAFVTALAEIEERFGYTLDVSKPVAVGGAGSPFGVSRGPDGQLALSLEASR